jgi:hypothetical protein
VHMLGLLQRSGLPVPALVARFSGRKKREVRPNTRTVGE